MKAYFDKYMQEFGPFVYWAMKKFEEVSVCKAGMSIVGDLARALGERMAVYVA
eukprot:CAMPEP_0201286008 /NCGR_PEP_ID=MMETSP1317-20130820/114148_1 /ASSEMBLY_ACC=CAM_ASM_000770 /TAXON_ID=187299 /ORGANISM="Undescribed Undescribed, Strain Undescribed" /LENGTH=52 /DNA_ID=CAMNT_0047612383 /DNA_START=1265 /DNA_END=1423 /DNA_ORIENTATION=-